MLFDTSVYISYKHLLGQVAQPGWYSVVVLQEMIAGANGRAELKGWEKTRLRYEKRGRLLVPDSLAWATAGRILNRYLSDLSRHDHLRRRPSLDHRQKQSIIRDVLIAVSAKQQNVTVISDNEDFPAIQQYYKFRWLGASAFFA